MNQIERILNMAQLRTNMRLDSLKISRLEAAKAIEETALAFTKWKDENYWFLGNNIYVPIGYKKTQSPMDEQIMAEKVGKTLEQLFDEWNNLKTT